MSEKAIHNVPAFRLKRSERAGSSSLSAVNEEILKQLRLLEETKIDLMVMEADRQRIHFGSISYHSTGFKAKDDQMMTNYAHLSVFVLTIVDYYQKGVNFYYKNQHDLSRVYLMLKEYVSLWTKRTQLDPDADVPPMADFIAIDDYLSKLHPDHELNQIAVTSQNIGKVIKKSRVRAALNNATSNAFKRMREVAGDKERGEHTITGFKPTRYVSLLNQFHENVWSSV